jgi:fatty-acyl-CoA synthase
MPKGVLWRQADFLAACLGVASTTEAIVAAAADAHLRALPAPPFMHGAAHWNALSAWVAGGTVIIQDHPDRLDAHDVLRTVDRERATSLLIVGTPSPARWPTPCPPASTTGPRCATCSPGAPSCRGP